MTENLKKTSKQSVQQSLIEEFAELLSVTKPEIIFSEAARIIAENFDCSSCYVMTLCEEKNILELQSIFDLNKTISLQGSKCSLCSIPEWKAIEQRDTFHTNKWLNNSEFGLFTSTKNDNISMVAEPLICDGSPIGTVSLFFENSNNWTKKQSADLKFACKYIAMSAKNALKIKLLENELKIKKLLEAILNYPYEDKDKTLRSIAKMIMRELGALNCMISSQDKVYCAEPDGFCSKQKTANCKAIELSKTAKIVMYSDVCPNHIKHDSYESVYYCIPLEIDNGEYGTMSLKFSDKKAPQTSDNFVLQDISSALSRFLSNFYAVSKYKALISINDSYVKRLQKYTEDLEFANSSMQYVNKRVSMANEFSRIFSSSTDLEQALIAILQKLAIILLNKPSFLISAVFEDNLDTGDIIVMETFDDIKKTRHLKINLKNDEATEFLKQLGDSKKITTLNDKVIEWLKNSLELGENSKQGYAWPVLLPNNQMIAMLIVGFKNDIKLSSEDEKFLNSLAYQMALPIRNGLLNKANVIEKNKLKAIINSIADGVITVNLKQKITACNISAQEIFALKESEMMKSYYDELISCNFSQTSKSPKLYENIWDGIAGAEKGYFKQEFQRTDKDGKLSFFDSVISPITYEGKNFGAVIVLRDITEKKDWDQAKNDFIAVIAHDLRTPLTAVKSYVSILMDHARKLTDEQIKEFYTIINSEMDRFTRLLRNFTSLGKMDLGKLESHPKTFNINELIKKVAHLHRLNTKKHLIELNIPNTGWVYADKDQMEQVLNNLLSNAIKYSPDGGTVKVSTTNVLQEKTLRVSVIDCGIGLTPEAKAKLFNRYTRVQNEATKYIQGTGLGLYICKILIESNGGNIGIESNIGEGSTFYIDIPKDKNMT